MLECQLKSNWVYLFIYLLRFRSFIHIRLSHQYIGKEKRTRLDPRGQGRPRAHRDDPKKEKEEEEIKWKKKAKMKEEE